MDDLETIKLPRHAVQFIAEMCQMMRKRLASEDHYSLQMEAAFDSINEIECALPNWVYPAPPEE